MNKESNQIQIDKKEINIELCQGLPELEYGTIRKIQTQSCDSIKPLEGENEGTGRSSIAVAFRPPSPYEYSSYSGENNIERNLNNAEPDDPFGSVGICNGVIEHLSNP